MYVSLGFERIVPSSRTMPTPILLALPSSPIASIKTQKVHSHLLFTKVRCTKRLLERPAALRRQFKLFYLRREVLYERMRPSVRHGERAMRLHEEVKRLLVQPHDVAQLCDGDKLSPELRRQLNPKQRTAGWFDGYPPL
jgi:hypothetical protein